MKKIAIAVVVGMAAASAFAVPIWTSLVSEGAKGETESAASAYSAYYCTKAAAQEKNIFGGNDTYETITAYLTKDETTYLAGMDNLVKYGTALDYYGFDEDEYAFSKYVKDGLAEEYLAVLAYTGALGEKDMVRVFSATADAAGSLTFAPADGKGEAGSWTTVPEPTSGLLLLLGMAGLALKRKHA